MRNKISILQCLRCNHKWIPRTFNKPRVCPKCKSAYYDTPRRKPIPKVEPPEVQAKEEIVSKEPPKEDDIDTLKRDCLACTEKYKTDGKWHCTSFNYKSRPKYDRCRLCWELVNIWGNQAAGYKERKEHGEI